MHACCTSFAQTPMLTPTMQLFAALSDTLNNQVKSVTQEKKKMLDDANQIINVIRQMEASLDESSSHHNYSDEDDELRITFPLSRCLKKLKEKQVQVGRLHRERFEQVKSEQLPRRTNMRRTASSRLPFNGEPLTNI